MNSQTPSEATMMNASRSPSGFMLEMSLGGRVRVLCMICAGGDTGLRGPGRGEGGGGGERGRAKRVALVKGSRSPVGGREGGREGVGKEGGR